MINPMTSRLQVQESPKARPPESKTFRVLYCKNRRELPFNPPTAYDPDNYVMVGRFKTVSLEDLFHWLNDAEAEPNPLGSPEMQGFIRDRFLHTSLSVGDIAIDETTLESWYCSSIGWTKIARQEA